MKSKDIKIVAATASEDVGGQHIYRDTTVPLAVQPQHIRDTSEISTPYSKKKQVIMVIFHEIEVIFLSLKFHRFWPLFAPLWDVFSMEQ